MLYRLVGINMISVWICSEDVESLIVLCTALRTLVMEMEVWSGSFLFEP